MGDVIDMTTGEIITVNDDAPDAMYQIMQNLIIESI
jgi:hypothetical protein